MMSRHSAKLCTLWICIMIPLWNGFPFSLSTFCSFRSCEHRTFVGFIQWNKREIWKKELKWWRHHSKYFVLNISMLRCQLVGEYNCYSTIVVDMKTRRKWKQIALSSYSFQCLQFLAFKNKRNVTHTNVITLPFSIQKCIKSWKQ